MDIGDIEKLYEPENFDFRLAPKSPAIAAGLVLPTINDGFSGMAPDLGAYQHGRAVPHYGPRMPVPGAPFGDPTIRTLAGPPPGAP